MEAKLVVTGGGKPAEIKLKLPTVIGRGREATLTVRHPMVSRKHCQIVEANGLLVVRDMGSLNGTFINNHQISEAVLRPGDLLTVGVVTFRAEYQAPEAAAGAAGQPAPGDPAEVEVIELAEDPAEVESLEAVELNENAARTEPAGSDAPKQAQAQSADATPGDAPTITDDDDLLASFADED